MIAYLNIDEVIAIIRKEDKPKPVLMARFKLSDTQAEAILELKLRHLAKLEEMKIRGEQDDLSKEQKLLEETLKSDKKLTALIRGELQQDKATFGDARRSQLVQRDSAQAMREEEMIPAEPITIILSQKGWIRSAKGHDFDISNLSYKAGDKYLCDAKGRSNQQAVFLDSAGRSYSLPAHSLPSARGQGEPLTGRLNPATSAVFKGLLIGEPEQLYLLASDAGYGFITELQNLYCKNRAGKAVLSLPKGSEVLQPYPVDDIESEFIVGVSNEGHILVFPVADLPQLSKGKGNKIMQIPKDKLTTREEYLAFVTVVNNTDSLEIISGKKSIVLKPGDLNHYRGERGRRGHLLPRAIRKVDAIQKRSAQ
jgi:topoisomerase-4 subunit A